MSMGLVPRLALHLFLPGLKGRGNKFRIPQNPLIPFPPNPCYPSIAAPKHIGKNKKRDVSGNFADF